MLELLLVVGLEFHVLTLSVTSEKSIGDQMYISGHIDYNRRIVTSVDS